MTHRGWIRRLDAANERRPLVTGAITAVAVYPVLLLIAWPGPADPFLGALGGSLFVGLVTALAGRNRQRSKKHHEVGRGATLNEQQEAG